MIVLAAIAYWFYNLAETNNGNKALWILSGIGGYIGAQFLAGLIIGLIFPPFVDNQLLIIIVGIAAGIGGCFGVKYMLESRAKNMHKSDNGVIDRF